MGLSFAYLLTIAIPGTPHVSWLAHLGGLIGGVAGGWIFRTRKEAAQGQARSGTAGQEGRAVAAVAAGGQALAAGPGHCPSPPDNPRADLHKELGELGL